MGTYIKDFETHSAYNTYINGGDVALPNVSYCEDMNEVHYNPIPDPYNGHAYVDLGLPSGTKWATMNVGASSVTDYGNYYRYGLGASQYDNAQTNYSGTENPLAESADTAVQVWGGLWHMPTTTQIQELKDNTTYEWVIDYEGSGINGGKFTAQNGNVLFIPAAGYNVGNAGNVGTYGYIWSSTPKQSDKAYYLAFHNLGSVVNNEFRDGGFSIRPVVG